MRMEGKVALISGGARGIGEAIARLFAREGACVTIGDILEDEGQRVAREIDDAGGRALFVRLDVTVEEEWRRAVQATVERFGQLNVLVNNAGIYRKELVDETSVEAWDEVMGVNAKGAFLGSKHAIPEMKKAGGGSIVNMSSGAGLVGNPDGAAYGASKGAMRSLTKATAAQYGKYGIRANSIHPGPIETAMLRPQLLDPGARESSLEAIPLGRIGTPQEIAYGALYLASDESSYVTGVELPIDGGRVAI
ncbi:MAG: SDR family oxidoreductase [Chloroflexi bacterium]|nr:SDR family oxidoreductase [Chloroflexota bacterium]